MANVDDVSRYLAKRISDVVYPDGISLPGILSVPVKVYPGWPVPGVLQQDMETGNVHVSVWALPTERRGNTPLGRPFRPVASGAESGKAVRELKRQFKDFQITVWAPTPALREKVGTAIDTAFAEQCHIDLGDSAPAQLLYLRQFDTDSAENWLVYRRDFVFSMNFATTQMIDAPEVIQTVITLNDQPVAK